jgi:serine/threonine protein kinase
MVKTIGTGTFARVYLCRHRRTDYYALKVWIEKLRKKTISRFYIELNEIVRKYI